MDIKSILSGNEADFRTSASKTGSGLIIITIVSYVLAWLWFWPLQYVPVVLALVILVKLWTLAWSTNLERVGLTLILLGILASGACDSHYVMIERCVCVW